MKRRTPLERLESTVESAWTMSNGRPLPRTRARFRRSLAAYRLHLAKCAEYATWNALASFTSEDLMHAASRAAREAVRKGKA